MNRFGLKLVVVEEFICAAIFYLLIGILDTYFGFLLAKETYDGILVTSSGFMIAPSRLISLITYVSPVFSALFMVQLVAAIKILLVEQFEKQHVDAGKIHAIFQSWYYIAHGLSFVVCIFLGMTVWMDVKNSWIQVPFWIYAGFAVVIAVRGLAIFFVAKCMQEHKVKKENCLQEESAVQEA